MNWIELFGNLGSVVILISLTMSNIVRLRWINMVGAAMFATYGALVGAPPVIFLNLGIVIVDIYYLYKLYATKECFKLVEASKDSEYLKHFLDVNSKELVKFGFDKEWSDDEKAFYMLRDNNTAGILAGREESEGTLFIDMDFVRPEYRDMKLGKYFFSENKGILKEKGYNKVVTKGNTDKHREYLEKIGFVNTKEDVYEKNL